MPSVDHAARPGRAMAPRDACDRSTRPALLARAIVATACLAAAGVSSAQDAGAARGSGTVLVHPFEVSSEDAWSRVSVELQPSAWRVGRRDGPPASEAQLRMALGKLAVIQIGGRCSSWYEGQTTYPCSFLTREIALAHLVVQPHIAGVSDLNASPPSSATSLSTRPGDSASKPPTPVRDRPHLVSTLVRLPRGADSASAYGGRLTFEIRAIVNAVAPSAFEPDSGVIVLHAIPGQGI